MYLYNKCCNYVNMYHISYLYNINSFKRAIINRWIHEVDLMKYL